MQRSFAVGLALAMMAAALLGGLGALLFLSAPCSSSHSLHEAAAAVGDSAPAHATHLSVHASSSHTDTTSGAASTTGVASNRSADSTTTATATASHHGSYDYLLDPRAPWRIDNPLEEIAQAKAKLRLYVYKTYTWPAATQEPFAGITRCLMPGMYEIEKVGVAGLRATVTVVEDPQLANVFLIPLNATCFAKTLTHNGTIWDKGTAMVSQKYIEPILRTVVHDFPYYNASGGRDHLAIFPIDYGTDLFSPWVQRTTSTMMRIQYFGMSPECKRLPMETLARNLGLSGERCGRSDIGQIYNHGRDIIFPQLVSTWTYLGTHQQTDLSSRARLAFMAGSFGDRTKTRFSGGLRQAIADLYDRDNGGGRNASTDKPERDRIVIVKGSVGGTYGDMLASSVFGLCPAGYAPWSPRLFDTISCGAVPVIIADFIVEPFEEYLDWRTFSIKVNNHHIQQLDAILTSTRNHPLLLLLQRNLQVVRPYLITQIKSTLLGKVAGPFDLLALSICERLGLCHPVRREVPPLADLEYYLS